MNPHPQQSVPSRGGLTLIELLIATSIIAMAALAMGSLARATQISASYVEGSLTATQHARVTQERINRAIVSASASEAFPGAAVFAESVSGDRFPDTLVVWQPAAGATAADPTGLPRFSELVVYCPNPNAPHELLEITARNDHRTVPALANTSQWMTELSLLKTGNGSQKVVLTDMLRTAQLSSTAQPRGCVRFESLVRPSTSDVTAFRTGSVAWNALPWPQHWYGATTGMRQTWIRYELQLLPHARSGGPAADLQVLPFLGSATLYYELKRSLD
jgi:prepilin-type N-terminal cleavage/methylation domain-containing protein